MRGRRRRGMPASSRCSANWARREVAVSIHEEIAATYAKWNAGDVDGVLAKFADNAMFLVPGTTRISGDHDKASFRPVLAELVGLRQVLICTYDGQSGAMWLFGTYATIDGQEQKYHAVHEWG